MWSKLAKFLDRFGIGLDVYQLLRGVGIIGGGALSGALSMSVKWINQFGWFGWWLSFLIGSVLTATVIALFSFAKLQLAQARAYDRFPRNLDSINPLENTFHKRRISLSDLQQPLNGPITGKRFTDCELVGPGVIFFSRGMNINGINFTQCDMLPTKRNLLLLNALIFEDCQLLGGSIIGATILLHPDIVDLMETNVGMNGNYYGTLTGNTEIDERLPKGFPLPK
jgi:MFS family permease